MERWVFNTFLSFVCLGNAASAQITLDPLPATTWCASAPFEVSFQASSAFDPGNVFSAELSDATGSFAAPIAVGSLASTTAGTIACTMPPDVSGTGYRCRVVSSLPAWDSGASVEVLGLFDPNAGINGSVSVCTTSAPFSLFAVLAGSPDPGGVWVDPDATGGLNGETLDPTPLGPGSFEFMYMVEISGCEDMASVTVTFVAAPDAGLNVMTAVCSSFPPFSMWMWLGAAADPGGYWTAPNGNVVPNMFDPATDTPGVYSYIVAGDPPCANGSATLTVTVDQVPDAGANTSLIWCASDGPFQMFDQLNGTPQPGGTWVHNTMPHAGIFDPGVDTPGLYVYSVPGVAPCMTATAELSITVGACLNIPAPQLGIQYLSE